MTSITSIDRKLRRLRAIEASYRHEIKRVEEEAKRETVEKGRASRRVEKFRAKFGRKIEKLQTKVRDLALKRAELKG